MNRFKTNESKTVTILLVGLIAIFLISLLYIRLITIGPLRKVYAENEAVIAELKISQEDQSELLDKINVYRDGLYALNLVLEARKQVISGSDPDNPYLVFDFTQVLEDLRQLLPRDARVTKFQVNNKGLVTLPIESVDYASLGRVLRSFKDKSFNFLNEDDNIVDPKVFKEVKIPSGAQHTIKKDGRYSVKDIYSFIIQAKLNPEFWQNPMPYPDVDSHVYYAQAIRDLTVAGTIEGYRDGYFRPMSSINRAEFFKVVLFEFLAKDMISVEDYKRFIDLSEDEWHYQYIQLASQMGIAEGDEVGRFHPDQEISRIEALKTILAVYDVEIKNPNAVPEGAESEEVEKKPFIGVPFTDVARDDRNFPVVLAAYQNGLLDNMGQKLQPNLPVTRFEVAYWVWRLKFDYL